MDFSEAFRDEAHELISDLETNLLELENDPENRDLIDAVFRALHTIKGSGAMFGFEEISGFAHEVENTFEKVRQGELRVTSQLISLTLKSQDVIRQMLDESSDCIEERESIIKGLKKVRGDSGSEKDNSNQDKPSQADEDKSDTMSYRIRFLPKEDIMQNGTNPLLLLEELNTIGTCDTSTILEKVPPINEFAAETCYFYWDIIIETNRGEEAIRDVFIFVEDECKLQINELDISDESPDLRLGEILVERGDISKEDLDRTLKKQEPLGKLLSEEGLTTSEKIETALKEQKKVREAKEKTSTVKRTGSIRVQSDKLDTLVDLVGELVTVQARLSQIATSGNDNQLTNIAETVEQLTWELRDSAMGIRMLPIGTTFEKFKRLVRDLSRDLGKEIQLQTSGSETELDKNVLEQLNDPMVHLIRNAVDHGVERPQERLKIGKPPQGIIHLSAHHAGANVIISIRDDGGGMKKERILEKAREKGLVDPSKDVAESDIFNLILLPGFSTNEEITSTSGRGVGMDVVKKNIEALNGSIEIVSNLSKGTEFRLKLPLTLAIIEGLLVEASGNFFVIPLSLVEECIELEKENKENQIINLRGEFVPFVHLSDCFDLEPSNCDHQQIVLTHFDETKFGIVVDRVVGEHQTVIKNLGTVFKSVKEVSGATILGDGTLALILDLPKLYESAKNATET